ncbi:MAG: hypothetical protein UT34_C0002G0078 [candidate division WS6 bacterium GW2011_GWF2_39_15]|uniref:Uncharacterized protein n=1 Tax=candidate division WS6 bacterium GW2011_GWF2_39_15 TaxID=1619100 RepID=A0A0G0MYE6_9BACT|nr:MAG: hypothetical protein UT34_C0002G0078 [candidate division WS6 bacterium GW2011_GWF2_39_15]
MNHNEGSEKFRDLVALIEQKEIEAGEILDRLQPFPVDIDTQRLARVDTRNLANLFPSFDNYIPGVNITSSRENTILRYNPHYTLWTYFESNYREIFKGTVTRIDAYRSIRDSIPFIANRHVLSNGEAHILEKMLHGGNIERLRIEMLGALGYVDQVVLEEICREAKRSLSINVSPRVFRKLITES